MSDYIFANPFRYNISITLAIFDKWEQITRRKFYLRNLTGQTESDQVAEATVIMAEVAEELHCLTGYGIDKGSIVLDGKKAAEIVYENHPPHPTARHFRFGVKIKFPATRRYQWRNGNRYVWRIIEGKFNDEWQRIVREENTQQSFRLPCMVSFPANPMKDHFFRYGGNLRRRRKIIGWRPHFEHRHPMYTRFITRFLDEGNLAISERRFWGSYAIVEGIDWAPPKIKTASVPKKSKLASLPVDDTEYVYLIRMGQTKYYKIGKSNDPQGRLASLQTASPYKLKLLHVFTADNASAAEETLHHKFHNVRQNGEWFTLTDNQRDKILSIDSFTNKQFVVEGKELHLEQLFLDT